MSSTNTSLNCQFCFNNISTYHFQQQNQKYLTPSDVISCCSKYLNKGFIDSLNWTNVSSVAGKLCQECYSIAEKLNNLNVNLNKIVEDINELGTRLNIRISKERRNYGPSTQKPSGVNRSSDTNQYIGQLPYTASSTKINNDLNYEVQEFDDKDYDHNHNEVNTPTGSFYSVTDNSDDSNGSLFEELNSAAENGEKCQLRQEKPISVNSKLGPQNTFAKKKVIQDANTTGKAVSKREEIITGSELQKHIASDAGYKCDKCNKRFSRITILRRHDCAKPTYECEVCKISFSGTGVLKIHMRSHTGEKPYKCETCGKSFGIKCHMTSHIRIHTGEKPLKCKFCEMTFRDSGGWGRHLATHENSTATKYKCDICSKFMKSLNGLKFHVLSHSGNRPEKCKICGDGFAHQKSLRRHEKMHLLNEERPHKCPVCGRSFALAKLMKSHMLIHSAVKPFLCEECGQSFFSVKTLRCHRRLHTEKGPFICKECGKIRGNSYSLKSHYYRNHSAKAIKCEKCGRAFQYKELLQKHLEKSDCTKTSTEPVVKPYSCENCEMCFRTERSRQMHKIKHLAVHERPSFVCDVCNKSFHRKRTLEYHHSTQHKDVPFLIKNENFPCKFCKSDFKFVVQYIQHVEKHTGENMIHCEHCPEIFSSLCQCTLHRRHVHPNQNSSFECTKCNISLEDDKFWTAHCQSYHKKQNRIAKQKNVNEGDKRSSFNKINDLTSVFEGKRAVDAENSDKESETSSNENEKRQNEVQM